MRGLAVVVVVVSLLALAQGGWAANLDSSWYVELGGIALWGVDPATGYDVGLDWSFTDGLGTYGPFVVTQPAATWPQRMVSVPANVSGVAAGTAVYLEGTPEATPYFPVTRLDVSFDTLYDSSQMQLDLLLRHPNGSMDLLWSQQTGGHAYGSLDVLDSSGLAIPVEDSIEFRVTTLPEPSTACVVVLALSQLAGRMWRKQNG